VDGGSWTDWEAPINDWATGPDRVELYVRDQTTTTSFWDTLAEASTIVDYPATFTLGTFTLTGNNWTATKAFSVILTLGQYALTLFSSVIEITGIQWINSTKSTAISPTNTSKNSITPTNSSKNNSTFNNQSKS
jgi:hypothetical protein